MDYKEIDTIDIKGKRILIKDSMILLDDNENMPEWPFVTIESGIYDINVLEKGDPYSSVQIIKNGMSGARGKNIGNVNVEHGGIAIIDYDTFLSTIQKNYDDYCEWTSMELDDLVWSQVSGKIEFLNEPLFFLHSGDGDGSYPVYEVVQDGNIIGIECDFYP